MTAPLRVAFVTTGLTTGGAEMMLLKLVSGMTREGIEPVVISLGSRGTIGPRIEQAGITVHSLGLGDRTGVSAAAAALRRHLRGFRPDVIQGWMYHGNLAATAGRALGAWRAPLVWSVRQSLTSLANEKRGTAAVIRAGAAASHWSPRAITYNSRVSARQHEALGYSASRSLVIPNGFDTTVFVPDPAARDQFRHSLGVAPDTVLVGVAARFHPMKNHASFLEAAAVLVAEGRDVRFLLVGTGTEASNPAMAALLDASGIRDRVVALGERSDMATVYAGLDIACLSSSWGEGFPNAVGEAMACGVPCVVTDVGDSAHVVGDAGTVVAPDHPSLLAAAIGSLADLGPDARAAAGRAARHRIVTRFSLDRIVAQYATMYRDAVAPGAPRRG